VTDFFRYPISANFEFLRKVSYKNRIFTNKKFKVGIEFLQDNIIKLYCNYYNNELKNYSDFKPIEIQANGLKHFSAGSKQIFMAQDLKVEFNLAPFSMSICKNNKRIFNSDEEFIGVNGTRIVFKFKKLKDTPFWGFGEKTGELNKNGQFMKMWNVDVVADLRFNSMRKDYEPTYVTIPFFITYISGQYWGFLLNNPTESFFDMGREDKEKFYFGTYKGEGILYIIYGPTLNELMKKLIFLTGTIDLPPLWSIGHHQSRWSYMTSKEVRKAINNYKKNKIPLSSIWLDIDYMEGYKIFTWAQKTYRDYAGLIKWLHKKDIAVVTIIDPGVKKDEDYNIYQEGTKLNLFCKTFNGKQYIGYVWPGKTVFPDFSLAKTQNWWSNKISEFLKSGVDGIWLDMNDPSTGDSEREDMLFKNGRVEHQFYHNQYGYLMAKATKTGFKKHAKDKRDFILTRSAYTGIQKYSAVWTGDNCSNWEHLQMTIPESLNLSLSGVSFNGADVGGFGGNIDEKLIARWYQANFLFPFFRNHSAIGTKYQEPYRFSKQTQSIIGKFINLRYKFLPYIYNLFYRNYIEGEPILRPLFYEYHNKSYFNMKDEFFVGPFILQAPVLMENDERLIYLPKGFWFNFFNQKWMQGKCGGIKSIVPISMTPLFMRDGAVIPVLAGRNFFYPDARDFKNAEFNVYIKKQKKISSFYYEDDGVSYDYKKEKYNLYEIKGVKAGNDFNISIKIIRRKYENGIKKFKFNIYLNNKIILRHIKL